MSGKQQSIDAKAAPLKGLPEGGRQRVFISGIRPLVDAGVYPAKGVLGGSVKVSVDLVADGHDVLAGDVLYRQKGTESWTRAKLELLNNDRYVAQFSPSALGLWEYGIEAWVDSFATWRRSLKLKSDAEQDVTLELLSGAQLVATAAERAAGSDASALSTYAERLANAALSVEDRTQRALEPDLAALMGRNPDRSRASSLEIPLQILVERERARFSAWYEFFPRSTGKENHGTFRDAEKFLPYVASMHFDIVYLPPIHPIGVTLRKGKNNTLSATDDDVGSPWAIGAATGGHKSVHPALGTLEDFRHFVQQAKQHGLEVALDVALQVSPDHPYVKDHPEWFKHRADGSIQYAENPPKKYQDIYPFDFECDAWQSLWLELRSIFEFWIEQGVRIFRVDNPHTKSLAFWDWCLKSLRDETPELIFLAEAFTRPKLMYQLAKSGFSQSYTYFTWRNSKHEFTEYLTELTTAPAADFFRPNFWPNTPDILPEHLQYAPRSAFALRVLLAATLSSNYGIYGPAFELLDNIPRRGAEEYNDNEKYELKAWDIQRPDSLRHLIARLNRIRRDNTPLQHTNTLLFHPTDNDLLICYSKKDPDTDAVILVVANLDVHHTQSGHVFLDLKTLGGDPEHGLQVHDLLSDERYIWTGNTHYISLDPQVAPAHVFRPRPHLRSENDFDYFM